jgi:hypothetical protein
LSAKEPLYKDLSLAKEPFNLGQFQAKEPIIAEENSRAKEPEPIRVWLERKKLRRR